MADERDPRVTQRYRELGGEEPPRELDQAILAAAHRAADRPHAPLVTPAGWHRWYFSLAAAAVLMLAVGIALHVDRQPPPEWEAANESAQRTPASPPAANEAKPAKESALAKERREAQPAEAPAVLADRVESAQRKAEVPSSAAAAAARADTPERELERIAELRRLGRDDEADKALAEFRKRYPDYKIPDEWRGRIERRPAQ